VRAKDKTAKPDPAATAAKLYAEGRFADARRALGAGESAEAKFLLGLLALEEGRPEEAIAKLAEAEGFDPPAPWAHRLGRLFFEHKNYVLAETWLRAALGKNPGQGATHYWLGNTLRMTGEQDKAERELKEAIRLEKEPGRAHVALAFLYREEARLDDAADTMLSLARTAKKDSEMMQRIAGFLAEIRRYDLAENVLSLIMPLEASNPSFLVTLGQLRQKVGLFEEAATCFRRALVLNPNADAAYLGLAVIRTFEAAGDPDAAIVRRALEHERLKPESQACAHFAMGKICDDLKEYDEAFGHFELANRMRGAGAKYDAAKTRAKFAAIRQAFTADAFKERAAPPVKGPTPVFVVGMLRSGTTLVERMLDAHPAIFGAGELNFIPALAEGLGAETGKAYPQSALEAGEAALTEAARYYLATLAGYAHRENLIVDKNPLNFIHLGLIALLFPKAKVIHCRRDPLDTCLSIYFQNFAHEANAYAYDLRAIGDFYRDYRALMDHWYAALPLDICDLDYEELVAAPEKNLRRVLAALGVPYDEKCLGPPPEGRALATASLWQARQPFYTSSVGRWRNYASHLQTLQEVLAGLPERRTPA
jgi:tetratricopeptide (TPR) repeat protein